MLCDVGTRNVLFAVLLEVSIAYEGKQLAVLLVVDAEHERVVGVIDLEKLVTLHEGLIEGDLLKGEVLVHPSADAELLDVVVLIRCIHHRWDVVHIPLLSHAGVHSQVGIA